MPSEPVKALKAHISLFVRDLAASIEFYRKIFGIEPSKVRTAYAKFDVANPPLIFTLNETASDEASHAGHRSLFHLGIQVHSAARSCCAPDYCSSAVS